MTRTPKPEYRKLKNKEHNPSPFANEQYSQQSSYEEPVNEAGRQQEKSVSDISKYSIINTPLPNFRKLAKKE
jgi:hypothetical protein